MPTLQEYMAQSLVSNLFTSEIYKEVWGNGFGITNSVGKLRKVLVHRPGQEILQLQKGEWEDEAGARILRSETGRIRNYFKGRDAPDLKKMQEQHDHLTDILQGEGIEVINLEDPSHFWTQLIFTRDLIAMTPHGAILPRFALYFRQGEIFHSQKLLAEHNIPILGAVQGEGTLEGGSFSMLDPQTAVVGRSVRVNDEGITQLKYLLACQNIELISVDIPASYIHLDEAFLPVDRNKILVSTFLLPHWFLNFLRDKGYELLETDPSDPFLTNNCLAIEPGRVIFSEKSVKTRHILEKSGIEVLPVDISEIYKMGGGIHCSTLPLWRDII